MSGSNRRQPARSARTSTTRPSNYYPSFGGRVVHAQEEETEQPTPHGFFPAIQHFTDGISALPKEVMRHMTLLKETEGKAYLPDQAIGDLVDKINHLPPPPRNAFQSHPQAFFGFSYNNSLNGSAPPSVVDGSLPGTQTAQSEQMDVTQPVDEHQDVRRREHFQLREALKTMIGVLDEKNMVLSSTNDTLARQLSRLDNILPCVEKEVSEEARLGSNTHWALPHMKEARRAPGPTNDRSRRDVQSANNLAAAAAAMHENDIAAARSEARREAMISKRRQNLDSDFDERQPSKRGHGGTKGKRATATSSVLDPKHAGQPSKRRRVDKDAAPGMERSISAALNGRLGAGREAAPNPRNAAPGETRKRPKPLPSNGPSKKRNRNNSPQLASSPTRGTFPTNASASRAYSPASSSTRPPIARGHQNSALPTKSSAPDASVPSSHHLSAARVAPSALSTPELLGITSVTSRSVPEVRSALRDAYTMSDGGRVMEKDGVAGTLVMNGVSTGPMKREDTEPGDAGDFAMRATGSIKPPTPLQGPITAAMASDTVEGQPMARSRSTRGGNGNGNGASSSVKRITASSPPLAPSYPRRAQYKGPHAFRSSPAPSGEADPEASDSDSGRERDREDVEGEASDGASSAGSDEPRYCICNQPSYGSMVACDNASCPHEWFHLECVGLSEEPPENTKWYCEECKRGLKRGRNGGR